MQMIDNGEWKINMTIGSGHLILVEGGSFGIYFWTKEGVLKFVQTLGGFWFMSHKQRLFNKCYKKDVFMNMALYNMS